MQDPKVATNPGDFIEDVRIVHTKSKAGESVSIFFNISLGLEQKIGLWSKIGLVSGHEIVFRSIYVDIQVSLLNELL